MTAAHIRSGGIVLVKVVCNREQHPRGTLIRAQGEHLGSGINEALDVPDLHLDVAQVLADVHIVRVPLQRVHVALSSLFVVAISPVKNAIHMPAHMGLHVFLQGRLCEVMGFLPFVRAYRRQIEGLHGKGLSMVGGFLENLQT